VSDESNEQTPNDEVSAPRTRQRIRPVRHWRQRYAGPDADYVFRKAIIVHGRDGKRRVEQGEPVDCDRDGISSRRLKALWYSLAIELRDDSAPEKVPGRKRVRDNAADRREEARKREAEDRKLREKRELRRELNARRREEEEQERLRERAIQAAEDAERREIEQLIADEEAAKLKAKVDKQLAERAKRLADEAKAEQKSAEEEAQLQLEKAALAQEREAQAKEEAEAARAQRDQETLEREAAREAKLNEHRTVRDGSQNDPKPLTNPDNRKLSAEEAKAAVEDFN